MTISLPTHGQPSWDTPLNTALNQIIAAISVETVDVVNPSGSALTISDVSVAQSHLVTLTAATVALTFPTPVAGKSFTLALQQDATGGRHVTWPASVRWSQDLVPDLTTTPAKTDVFSFECLDGAHWLGFVAGLNYS